MKPRHILPSVAIVVCLVMQASVALTGTKIWPFMAYCMYAIPKDAPPRHRVRRVMLTWDDGSRDPVRASMLGVGWWGYERHYLRPMMGGDAAVTAEVVRAIDAADARTLVSMTVELTTYTVTDAGIVETKKIHVLWPLSPKTEDTP